MKDTGLRGLALLDAAIAQIEAHPETWDQGAYRCGSGMCVAGWACQLAGGMWGYPAEDDLASFLVPEEDDCREDILTRADDDEIPAGHFYVPAGHRAGRLLGISIRQRLRLFDGDNTLARIKALRDELIEAGDIS